MITLIPDIVTDETKSGAEVKLFYQWSETKCKEQIIVLHSLGIAEHIDKVFGEIDFVVICNDGILCIEVKGGGVKRQKGKWYFTDRHGKTNIKTESPFQQVQGNMQSLRKYIKNHLAQNNPVNNCQFASCVIFPECDFKYDDGVDIITDILFDRTTPIDLPYIIKNSFKYWKEQCYKKHSFYKPPLTENDIKYLTILLRADFCCLPSLNSQVSDVVQNLLTLTKEQFNVILAFKDNDHILVSGVAGTGKTLLAIEQCRRICLAGKKCLYLCFNHNILQYVKSIFDKEGFKIDAFTLHALMMKGCGESGEKDKTAEYYNCILPQQFLKNCNLELKYDYIVIDEGQDLLKPLYLKCFDKLLNKGLASGQWCFFYDPNQNIYNTDNDLNESLKQLEAAAAKCNLLLNCRNTKQIRACNICVTNFKQAETKTPEGPKVTYCKYSSLKDELNKVTETLTEIQKDGLALKNVVLLSAYNKNNEHCCLSYGNIPESISKLKTDFVWEACQNELRFSTIASFKGLEAQVVLLLDIDGFADSKHRLLNYVGISRACAALYIFYKAETESERQKMLLSSVHEL